jgi:hypothetical protein
MAIAADGDRSLQRRRGSALGKQVVRRPGSADGCCNTLSISRLRLCRDKARVWGNISNRGRNLVAFTRSDPLIRPGDEGSHPHLVVFVRASGERTTASAPTWDLKSSRDPKLAAKLASIVGREPAIRAGYGPNSESIRRPSPSCSPRLQPGGPSGRPQPTRTADQAGALPGHDTPLTTQPRHHHLVCRLRLRAQTGIAISNSHAIRCRRASDLVDRSTSSSSTNTSS